MEDDEILIQVELTPKEMRHIIKAFDLCGTISVDPADGVALEDRINEELCNALVDNGFSVDV